MNSIHTTMINILKFKTHPSIILFILVIYGCGSGGENKTSIINNARQTWTNKIKTRKTTSEGHGHPHNQQNLGPSQQITMF